MEYNRIRDWGISVLQSFLLPEGNMHARVEAGAAIIDNYYNNGYHNGK